MPISFFIFFYSSIVCLLFLMSSSSLAELPTYCSLYILWLDRISDKQTSCWLQELILWVTWQLWGSHSPCYGCLTHNTRTVINVGVITRHISLSVSRSWHTSLYSPAFLLLNTHNPTALLASCHLERWLVNMLFLRCCSDVSLNNYFQFFHNISPVLLVKIYLYFLFFLISISILRLLFILGLYENGKTDSAAIPSGDIC